MPVDTIQLAMKKFTFKYKDAYSHWNWNVQVGVCKSLRELVSFYGLGRGDVEWQLLKVEGC